MNTLTPEAASAASESAVADVPPPKGPKMIRLYNKGKSTFSHGEFKLAPGAFEDVPEDVAALWLKDWRGGVVQASDANDGPGGRTQSEWDRREAELLEHLAAANKANLDAEARLKKLEAMLAEAQKPAAPPPPATPSPQRPRPPRAAAEG